MGGIAAVDKLISEQNYILLEHKKSKEETVVLLWEVDKHLRQE